MMLFALCSDHPSDLRSANLFPLNSGFESMLSFAENYRRGGDAIAQRLLQERAQGGGALTTAVDAAREYNTINSIDALFALNGIEAETPTQEKEKIYNEALNILQTRRAADYGVVYAREHLISLDTTLKAAFDHLDESSKQAFAQKVVESGIIQNTVLGVKGFKTFTEASEPFANLMGSIGTGLAAGTAIIGTGAAAAKLPAAGAALYGCARDIVCRSELMTGLAYAALEEVSGAGQMVAGTAKVISKSTEVVLETANKLAMGLLKKKGVTYAELPTGYSEHYGIGSDVTKSLSGYRSIKNDATGDLETFGPNGFIDKASNWIPDHFPDIKGFSLDKRLPIRSDNSGGTQGVSDINGKELFFSSGIKGPGERWYNYDSGQLPHFQSATHVESHATGYMIDNNIKEMTITINNIKGPCPTCLRDLPKKLPEGSVLNVRWINAKGKTITTPIVGTGSRLE